MARRSNGKPDIETAQAQSDFVEVAEKKEAVVLVITFEEAWAALQGIQLAVSNAAEAMGPLAEYAIEVGQKIQRLVSKTPALAQMAAEGWPKSAGGPMS